MKASKILVDIQNLVLGGKTIFCEQKLEFNVGSWMSIIGPNGAGKSSLLKLVCGLLKLVPNKEFSGKVSYFSEKLQNNGELHLSHFNGSYEKQLGSLVGYIGAESLMAIDIPVKQFIRLGEFPNYFAESFLLDFFEVEPYLNRSVLTLSSGEFQYLNFIRILNRPREFIFLDEAFSRMDFYHLKKCATYLIQKIKLKEVGVVFVSHDLQLATAWSNQLIGIECGGQLVQPFEFTEEKLTSLYGRGTFFLEEGVKSGKKFVLPAQL